MNKHWIIAGALSMALAVVLGAFGAHALKNSLADNMQMVYHTASQYHVYHSLGLILLGIVAGPLNSHRLVEWSGYLMLIGILLFSGSLYLLAVSGVRWLGAITPFGGMAFIISWTLLAIAVWRSS